MNPSVRSLSMPVIRRVACASMLLGSVVLSRVQAANKTWDGGGADNNWLTGANWDANTPPSANDSLTFTGTIRLTTTNTLTAGTVFNGITFLNPAGPFTLRGNQITLGGDITDNQTVVTETINLPLALSATRNLSVVSNASLAFGGVISGAGFGLTKTDGGLLTLSAANTFSGAVTINGGVVSVAADSNLGAAPGAATPGRIVINGGTLRATSSFTLNGNRGIALGPTSGSGTGIFDVPVGTALTYGGTTANSGAGIGGLAKIGFGGLTLSGANTYSGPTLVQNGTLTLDFTQTTSPLSSIINVGSSLTLGGANAGFGATNFAALIVTGKASATNSQAFNGTSVTFGGSVIRASSGSGGTANLALGALGHDPGGTLVMVPPTLAGGSGNITTTATNINGILGGFATISDGTTVLGIVIGTNFASVDGSGNVGNFTNYRSLANGEKLHAISTAGTNLLISSTVTGDMLVDDDNANTVTDVSAINWNRTDGGVTLKIGIGNTLRLGRYGSIFKPNTTSGLTWLIGETAAGANSADQNVGTLTAGGADNTPGEIIVNVNNTSSSSGTLIIDSQITDNGTGPVTFVKAGVGSMKLRGHNTHSGGTYLLQGRVQFVGGEGGVGTGNADAGGTGPIYILPGCYLYPSGTGPTTPVTNAVFIAGNGTAGEPLGAIRTSANWLFNGPWTLIGDTTIGGNGGASGAIGAKLSGPFNLALCSAVTVNGTVCLTNSANDWSGTTTLSARLSGGTPPLPNTFLSGNSEIIPNGFGKGNVVMAGGDSRTITWNLNGFSETINGLLTSGTSSSCIILNNGATPSTLTVGDNDQSATFGGSINNGTGTMALTKIGGGIETLTSTNAYTGDTTVNGGTLALSGSGTLAGSANLFVNTNATLDVSGVPGFNTTAPANLNGGTLVVASAAAVGPLNLTNSRVRLTTLGGTNVVTTTLAIGGTTNLIDIISVGFITSYPTQFTVIKYTGAIGGAGFNFGVGAVPSPSTVGFISNNTANSSVDLVLLDGPKPLTWTGNKGRDWDISTTTNWLAFTVTPVGFLDADSVIFGDGASTNVVNLTTVLSPGTVVVSNQALNYTFTGPGLLSGFGSLLKDGTGALTLANSGLSDFRGGLSVSNGTLILASDTAISGGATISSSATVQVGTNGTSGGLPTGSVADDGRILLNRSDAFTLASVISGAGTVVKTNPNVATLSGASSSFAGQMIAVQGTLRAGAGGALGGGTAITIVSNAATLDVNGQTLNTTTVRVRGTGVGGAGAIVNNGADSQNALGNVILEGNTTFGGTGRWDIRGGLATLSTEGNAYSITKTGSNQVSLVAVTVDTALADINVQQGLFSVETTTSSIGNAANSLTVASGATLQLYGTTAPFDKHFVLNGDGTNTTLNTGNGSGNGTYGTMTLNGNCIFNAAAATALNISSTLSGSGSLTITGAGTNVLSGIVSYTGATTVSNGTLIVYSSKGSAAGITVRGGTLGGSGSIAEPVVIAANGVLSPGDSVVPTSTLFINNTLVLSGTTRMDVNKLGGVIYNDSVTNVTALTLGGTLSVVIDPLSEPLVQGDSIRLFGFNTVSGAFTAIVPATPAAGLAWDTSQLASSGILKIGNAPPPQPTIGTVTESGTNLIFTGTGGTAGSNYFVLVSTNVATPVSNWTRLTTNVFDTNGNFSITNAVNPAVPQQFYRLQLP